MPFFRKLVSEMYLFARISGGTETMSRILVHQGGKYRTFACHTINVLQAKHAQMDA